MSTQNQPPSDPLAPFSTEPQPSNKFKFGGYEWDNQQSAELAYAQHLGKLSSEKEELQRLAQERAAQTAPAQQQYATGREAATFRQDQWLPTLAEDGRQAVSTAALEAIKDPNNPYGQVMRTLIQSQIQMRQEMNENKIRTSHPEIDWNDPKVTRLIEERRQQMGFNGDVNGSEATILMLQRDRLLPTREQFQQHMYAQQQAAQAQQQPQYGQDPYGNVVQMQTPAPNFNTAPPVFRPGYAAPTIDENAALDRMTDPSTPIEESRRIHAALLARANPASKVG